MDWGEGDKMRLVFEALNERAREAICKERRSQRSAERNPVDIRRKAAQRSRTTMVNNAIGRQRIKL